MTVRVAVVDDYALVVAGVARLLEPYTDRVQVVEMDANEHPIEPIDVALYDAYAQGQANHHDVDPLLVDDTIERVVMYTWNFSPELIDAARRRGMAGYLSKALHGHELADAIVQVNAGGFVLTSPTNPTGRHRTIGDWPGRDLGLTERESEVLALLTQGFATQRIADTMFLSPNTVKTHFKTLYRKLRINSRSEAVLWGIDHGFRPDNYRERHPNDP